MFSQKIINNLKNASFIRAMFEQGEKLRKTYGADNVFDFSIGNPDPEPPAAAIEALKGLVLNPTPKMHGYMSNAGYPDVRDKVAKQLTRETGVNLTQDSIVMTCGAGGALNVVLKTLLNPDEEVIVFSPFFVEYLFYIDNHGGKGVIVPTQKDTFEPDLEALKSNITPKTKAIIINTPNNPTGIIYSEQTLMGIAGVLALKEKEYGTTIYIVSDEPYRKLVYDNIKVPSVLATFKNSVMVDSFSKSLSLPGERIGYIVANPAIEDVELFVNGLIFCNRTLGFVNAPALFQRLVGESIDAVVDTAIYKERRDLLYNLSLIHI